MYTLAPSILSGDFAYLGEDLKTIKSAGCRWVHVDVMDGNFVPNITIGMPTVAALRKYTDLVLDVHLMIDRPLRYVEAFCKAGADYVTIHIEADTTENNLLALDKIHALGAKAAVSVKPNTPASAVLPFLDKVDMIHPGHDRGARLRRPELSGKPDGKARRPAGSLRRTESGVSAGGGRRRQRPDRRAVQAERCQRPCGRVCLLQGKGPGRLRKGN